MSLAGCRDSVPAGVWGNAPTVPRPTNPKEVTNKGAGSEASLPVTLRFRRSAPPSCSFQHLCCVAPNGRDHVAGLTTKAALLRKRGFRACGRDQRAMKTDEVCGRPLETFGAATFGVVCGLTLLLQGFRLCGGDQRAMKTGEVCGRPLETFGSPLPELTFVAAGGTHACGYESCHHCLVMGQPTR